MITNKHYVCIYIYIYTYIHIYIYIYTHTYVCYCLDGMTFEHSWKDSASLPPRDLELEGDPQGTRIGLDLVEVVLFECDTPEHRKKGLSRRGGREFAPAGTSTVSLLLGAPTFPKRLLFTVVLVRPLD